MIDPAVAALVQASASALDLTLSNDSRTAVEANLAILLQRAADFMDIALDDHVDPAPLLRL